MGSLSLWAGQDAGASYKSKLGQEQQPVLGKVAMLRTKKEMGVLGQEEVSPGGWRSAQAHDQPRGNDSGNCDVSRWTLEWSESPLRNTDCYLID